MAESDLAGLCWRFVGPYRGGRATAVAGHPTAPGVFFHGTSSGGVWRTDDAGAFWRNVSDGFFRRASVGALAVAEADPNVVYAGMGECGLRSNVTHGDGVYRSDDGGASWRHLGLAETQNIARVRVHPRDPDLVYVAAFGHRFGPNPERGVYRTRDGGRSWDLVLHRGPDAGAIDLSVDGQNPRVLYAAFWDARLFPWRRRSGGPGSGLWKSNDGGESWVELSANPGFPSGIKGRIGVAASPVHPGRVWAIVEAAEGGIYRSDDGGASWTWLNDDRNFLVRPWYFGKLLADPVDPHAVFIVGRKLWRSADGGRTFRQVNVPYVDQQDLWVDPTRPSRMILGNDGGAAVSFTSGDTWSSLVNQPTAEIYRAAADTRFPYRIYGSQQDNSTISLPSRSERGAIAQADWYDVGGGESGFIAVRPDDPDVVYSSDLPGLGVTRYSHRTFQIREVGPWPESSSDEGRLRYRFNWSTPVLLSPHDPNVLYVAANRVFRSLDEGATWEPIGPDLTRRDPEKMKQLDGFDTWEDIQDNHYCTIASLAESPRARGVFWAGSDDGLVHLSRDDGATWRDVTPPGLPTWATTNVEASPHDPAAAYVAATAHALDDFRPYLFRTRDHGESWEAIAAGIPADEFVRVIREDPVRRGLLYAATEAGVYVSLDDGASWRSLRRNLPVVAVHDLVVKDADLVAATHGRGLWILDDVSPLRELAERPEIAEAPAHLFAPRPVHRLTRHVYGLDSLNALYGHFAADNPASGVVVYFHLKEEAAEVTVSLLDGEGAVVAAYGSLSERPTPAPIGPMAYKLGAGGAVLTATVAGEAEPGIRWGPLTLNPEQPSAVPTRAGLNRFALPILYPAARGVAEALSAGITAPIAPPGHYAVRLTVDGRSWERPVEILPDPRLATTPAEYRAQFDLMIAIRDKVSQIHDAVNRLREVRRQATTLARPLRDRPEYAPASAAARSFLDQLAAIEAALIQTGLHARSGELDGMHFPIKLNNKLEALGFVVARSDDPPTAQAYEMFAELAARVDRELARLDDLLGGDLPALNALARDLDIPAIVADSGYPTNR